MIESARESEKREEYLRRVDDMCNEIDRHNDELAKSRHQATADAIVDFNDYARPYVIHEMDGIAYRSTVYPSTRKYRQNYDMIDWSKK